MKGGKKFLRGIDWKIYGRCWNPPTPQKIVYSNYAYGLGVPMEMIVLLSANTGQHCSSERNENLTPLRLQRLSTQPLFVHFIRARDQQNRSSKMRCRPTAKNDATQSVELCEYYYTAAWQPCFSTTVSRVKSKRVLGLSNDTSCTYIFVCNVQVLWCSTKLNMGRYNRIWLTKSCTFYFSLKYYYTSIYYIVRFFFFLRCIARQGIN
jgi:hypothetical protein